MSAVVAVHKEKSLILATDSRLGVHVSDGEDKESGHIDGLRKMVPVGADKVLVQGSAGGMFRPEEHPDLVDELAPLSVEETAHRLAEWSGDVADRSLYLYVGGVDEGGQDRTRSTLAGVHGEGTQIMRSRDSISTVGMEMLTNRLHKPVMYPEKAGGKVSPKDFIDMPVRIGPSDLSVPEALDCAVWLLRMAGKYIEFLSGDDRERARSDANVSLDENGRGVRTIGGPIHAAVLLRDGPGAIRTTYTFGDPHKSIHRPADVPC